MPSSVIDAGSGMGEPSGGACGPISLKLNVTLENFATLEVLLDRSHVRKYAAINELCVGSKVVVSVN